MPFNNRVQVLGNGFTPQTEKCKLINRTGAALVKGDLVCLNLDGAATAGQAMAGTDPATEADGATGYVLSAAITPTATNIQYLAAVLLDDAGCADNAIGNFGIQGLFQVSCQSGVAIGDLLTMVTSNTGATVQKHSSRTTAGSITGFTVVEMDAMAKPVGVYGVALAAASSETTALCLFDGRAYLSMFGGGA